MIVGVALVLVVAVIAALSVVVAGNEVSETFSEIGSELENETTTPNATDETTRSAPVAEVYFSNAPGDCVTGMKADIFRAAERELGPDLVGILWNVYFVESCDDLNEMAANTADVENEALRGYLEAAIRWTFDDVC